MIVRGEQLLVEVTNLCPLSPDGDGDGYSVSDGDCDDSEVTGADDSGDTSGPLDGEVGYSGGCDDSDPGQSGCGSGLDLGCGGCCGGSGLAWVFIGGWGLRRRRANTRS